MSSPDTPHCYTLWSPGQQWLRAQRPLEDGRKTIGVHLRMINRKINKISISFTISFGQTNSPDECCSLWQRAQSWGLWFSMALNGSQWRLFEEKWSFYSKISTRKFIAEICIHRLLENVSWNLFAVKSFQAPLWMLSEIVAGGYSGVRDHRLDSLMRTFNWKIDTFWYILSTSTKIRWSFFMENCPTWCTWYQVLSSSRLETFKFHFAPLCVVCAISDANFIVWYIIRNMRTSFRSSKLEGPVRLSESWSEKCPIDAIGEDHRMTWRPSKSRWEPAKVFYALETMLWRGCDEDDPSEIQRSNGISFEVPNAWRKYRIQF